MNILQLNSEKNWRGGEQQLAYLLEGLKNTPEIKVWVMGKADTPLEQWCKEKNIPFIAAAFKGSIDFLTARKIAVICKKHKIDLMHAQTSHAHAAALYSKFFRNAAKLLLHRRVSFPVKKNKMSWWKYNSAWVEHIICVSKNAESVLRRSLSPEKTSSVIYSAFYSQRFSRQQTNRADFFKNHQLPEQPHLITNVAALSPEKDQLTFLRAAKIFLQKHPDTLFVIAGEGKQRQQLTEFIEENNLEKSVFLLGFIKNVPDLLKHSDAFVLCSTQEGLGSSLLDAFYCKVPCVATNAGGMPEIVQDKKTGLLVPVSDPEALAIALRNLKEQPEQRKQYIERAYQLVNQQFSKEEMLKNTLDCYQKLHH